MNIFQNNLKQKRVIKLKQIKQTPGQEKAATKSKYDEEVRINNHTTCWGSFWKDGLWGYKCCRSTIKMSYCVGLKNTEEDKEEEKEVKEVTWQQKVGLEGGEGKEVEVSREGGEKSLMEQHREKISKKEKKKHKKSKKKRSKKKSKKKRKRESSSSDSSE